MKINEVTLSERLIASKKKQKKTLEDISLKSGVAVVTIRRGLVNPYYLKIKDLFKIIHALNGEIHIEINESKKGNTR